MSVLVQSAGDSNVHCKPWPSKMHADIADHPQWRTTVHLKGSLLLISAQQPGHQHSAGWDQSECADPSGLTSISNHPCVASCCGRSWGVKHFPSAGCCSRGIPVCSSLISHVQAYESSYSLDTQAVSVEYFSTSCSLTYLVFVLVHLLPVYPSRVY